MGTSGAAELHQYLSFSLGGTDCAVSILKVREILQYDTITRVPAVPASIRGVINLRGSVVPVMDLARKFGLPETAVTKRTCILIVEAQVDGAPTVLGVLADTVSEVVEFGPADIEPPPSFGTRVRVDFLQGMGKVAKGFLLLLDLDRVLSVDEQQVAASIERAGGTTPTGPDQAVPRVPGAAT